VAGIIHSGRTRNRIIIRPMAHSHHPHSHDHAHGGHHHHHGAPDNHGRAFAIAIALNTGFVAVELAYGFIADSTALIADAGHNLSDVLGLSLAWAAAILSRRLPSNRYTYGLRSTSILAALANSVLLMFISGAIALEALHRFVAPPAVGATTVMWVAGAGIIVNGASAWLFARGGSSDLNIRGAYLHMLADAAVSLAVVVVGLAMMFTGWYWLDPAISLVIVAVIVAGTWKMLEESLQLALSAVPAHIDAAAVENYLRLCPGVLDIHDLHIWGMSTTESALTVHLVMPEGYPGDDFMDDISRTLRQRFGVHHSTLQVEQGTTEHVCVLHARH
jgi:cobalt-zinc-cadmium efflux system protein